MRLTNRELDVIAAVWELGSATVTEVLERLGEDLAYTTVLTVLRTLEAKGAVRHRRDGKAYRYTAAISPDDVGERSISRLLDKVFQGSRELLIARLVSGQDVTPEELERIRKLLDERLREVKS